MPPQNCRGSHHDHGLEQRARSRRQRRDQPSVQSPEPGTPRRAAEHHELVAEQQVLGGDDGARGEESQDGRDYVAEAKNPGGSWLPATTEYILEVPEFGNANYGSTWMEGGGFDVEGNYHPDPGNESGTDPYSIY
jgi:hypothetical protein